MRTRRLPQLKHCRHQASLTAGTVFAHTKLPLTIWFLTIYLLSQQRNGISALEGKRHLGVSCSSAWNLKHKLLQAMRERGANRPRGGVIEIDDVYWAGEWRGGLPERGSPTRPRSTRPLAETHDGRPRKLRMSVLQGFRKAELAAWAAKFIDPNTSSSPTAWAAFVASPPPVSSTSRSSPAVGRPASSSRNSPGSTPLFGNVKTALQETCHQASRQHLQRYRSEFCYRCDLATLVPRLGYAAPVPRRSPTGS